MKSLLFTIALSLFGFIQLQAQNGVAISTSSSATPNASAILDVQSTTQGMLIPRLDIADLSNAAPVTSPSTSLMVYNTNPTTGPGFFYWDGSAWVKFGGAKELNDLSDVKTVSNNTGAVITSSYYFGNYAPSNATGKLNVGLGDYALTNATTGHENTALGPFALEALTQGSYNTALGEAAGANITTGEYNIVVGRHLNVSAAGASNELNIGDAIYATGIYGSTAKVGVGNGHNAPKSTLDVGGSLSLAIRNGGTTTLTETDYTYLVDVDGATVTLPDATNIIGRVYLIMLTAAFASSSATVTTTSSQNINSATTYTLSSQFKYVKVQSTGTNWVIIGQN